MLRRLSAEGSRIRTFRPSRDQCLSELVEPCAEITWRPRGEFLRGGTNSSNLSPSSGESVSRGISPSHVEKPIRVLVVREGPMVRIRLPPGESPQTIGSAGDFTRLIPNRPYTIED
jgi:hypothetical protein